MKMKSWMIILAALLLAVLPAFACAEADDDTAVIIVKAPEQEKAERPPCFPDPSDNFIPLPETENLAEGKPIEASAHNDVYVSSNLNDGKTTTYWESKGFPAEITFDLQAVRSVSTVSVLLESLQAASPKTRTVPVNKKIFLVMVFMTRNITYKRNYRLSLSIQGLAVWPT